jgi:hypothetical protein
MIIATSVNEKAPISKNIEKGPIASLNSMRSSQMSCGAGNNDFLHRGTIGGIKHRLHQKLLLIETQ